MIKERCISVKWVIVPQLVSMGKEQATQQQSDFHGDINKRDEVPYQPAPATLVHVPKGQWRKNSQLLKRKKRG